MTKTDIAGWALLTAGLFLAVAGFSSGHEGVFLLSPLYMGTGATILLIRKKGQP